MPEGKHEDIDACARRLVIRVLDRPIDAASMAVLERAMRAAIECTHECGTPEGTERAVIDVFLRSIYAVVMAMRRHGRSS